MSEKKPEGKKGISAGKVAALSAIAPFVLPIINKMVDQLNVALQERKQLVEVPKLYLKSCPANVDEVSSVLKEYGFSCRNSMVPLNEASVKFKDCFEGQVVGIIPKEGSKVKPGTMICIRWVNQEMIDKSKIIFEELEAKKAIRREKKKQAVAKTAISVKESVKKLPSVVIRNKKEDSDDE